MNSSSKLRLSIISSISSDLDANCSKSSFVATSWRFSTRLNWLLFNVAISSWVGKLSSLSTSKSVFFIKSSTADWFFSSFARSLLISSFCGSSEIIFETWFLISENSSSKEISFIAFITFEVTTSFKSEIIFLITVNSELNSSNFFSISVMFSDTFALSISSDKDSNLLYKSRIEDSNFSVLGNVSMFWVTSANVFLISSVDVTRSSVVVEIFVNNSLVTVSSSFWFIILAAVCKPSISGLSAKCVIFSEISSDFWIIESIAPCVSFKLSFVTTFESKISKFASLLSIEFK